MKPRTLLLAGSIFVAVGPIPAAFAQPGPPAPGQPAAPQAGEKEKQAPKGQPKQQPPAAKGQAPAQPPAAQGQPPAGQPQRTQAPQPQPQRTQAPPAEPPKAQPAQPQPQRPAAREEQPRPPAGAGAPGQPPRPASREPGRPTQTGQPPGSTPPPAARTRPGEQQPPAAQGEPTQPRPPAAQGRPTSPPAAQGRPGQPPPPAAQGQPAQPQQPAAQGQPTAPPPAARTRPGEPQQPAAQGRPGQPPPAAQGQPTQPQQPAAQGQPTQPPAAQGRPEQPPAAQQGQPTQPPAAQGRPGQPPPAAQGQQPGQPPAGQAQTPGGPPSSAAAPPPAQKSVQPAITERGSIAPQPTGSQGQPLRRVEDVRSERREVREGDRVFIREPDRVIIQEGGRSIIRHNEVNRFLMGGREVGVDRRGGETTTIIERPDGTRIITVTDEDGRLIRRVRRSREGREVIIIDNRDMGPPGTTYYVDLPPPVVRMPRERYIVEAGRATPEIIYETLMAPPVERIDRRYTLEQVRYNQTLRERMPRVDLDTINFDSGSWEIGPDQINRLALIASAIGRAVERNPGEVFLIEGHTDAVGPDVDNLSLSDRRAESAALALTERFQIPAENLTTQGYGEQYLKVQTEASERQNRRVTVRRITPLLGGGGQSTGQAR